MTVSPSGKALDCKSFIPQFESEYCLSPIFMFYVIYLYTITKWSKRGDGGMVDTTDLKSVD